MALTQADVKAASPLKKDYRLNDDKGLFLLVESDGQRSWKLKYRFNERNKVITLGAYPEMELDAARKRRDAAREMIADGVDPVSRCVKREVSSPSVETLEAVVEDWLEKVYRFEVSEAQFRRTKRKLENMLVTGLGRRVLSEATPEDLKALSKALGVDKQWQRGRRMAGLAGRIYRHGRDAGVAGFQYGSELKKRWNGSGTQPEFILSWSDRVFNMTTDVFGRWSRGSTATLLKLSVWLLAKPSELVNARWSDLDLDAAEWRIHRQGKDGKRAPTVTLPLPQQAVALLRELEPVTGRHEYVFPASRNPKRHMGSATLRHAMKRVSSASPLDVGNLRSLAASALGEVGYQAEQIQALLQQAEEGEEEQQLNARRDLLQSWADYLDKVRSGKVPLVR